MNIKNLFWIIFSLGGYYLYHSLANQFIDLNVWVDNYRYSWFYEYVGDIDSFQDLIYHGTINLGMSEVLPLSIFKICSLLSFDYFEFTYIINSLFCMSITTLLSRHLKVHPVVAILLVFSNFYVFKLMFTLHKLKIAMLLLSTFLVLFRYERIRIFSLVLVGFSAHYQILILTPLAMLKSIKKFSTKVIVVLLLLALMFSLSSIFLVKFMYYFKGLKYFDFIVSLFFVMALSAFLSPKSFKFLLPILGAVMFFGNSRLNILLYFVLIAFLKNRKVAFFLLIIPNIWFWYRLSFIL